MRDNGFLKRLRKKAKRGLRGWPLATIAFYGPNLSQATKAAVGIIPSENAEAEGARISIGKPGFLTHEDTVTPVRPWTGIWC